MASTNIFRNGKALKLLFLYTCVFTAIWACDDDVDPTVSDPSVSIFFLNQDSLDQITPITDALDLELVAYDVQIADLKDQGIEVEERLVSIDEIVEAHKNGQLTEVFGAGTAAVISNVELIAYNGEEMKMPAIETHKIAHMLKNTINGIRSGEVADKFDWIVPVKRETVKV